MIAFFFSSRRRHTRCGRDWSSDVCSSDLWTLLRKKGLDYGPRAFRAVPDHVDEEIPVPLPKKCPDCGGRVIHDDTQPQYQEDRSEEGRVGEECRIWGAPDT